jgi:hypothetical protein
MAAAAAAVLLLLAAVVLLLLAGARGPWELPRAIQPVGAELA